MLVIVLAVLGVPLWLVLGALGAGLWSRRSFRRAPGVFAARCRTATSESSAEVPEWPRRGVYARWVHDVLMVHQGIALVRTRALPVAVLWPSPDGSSEVRAMGDDPVVMRLRLDDGQVVDVAAAAGDRRELVGPFGDRHDADDGRHAPEGAPSGSPGVGW